MPIIRRTRLFKTAFGVYLVALAVVVWSWDISGVHSVPTRKTLHVALNNLVLLTMGIMMPETC